MSQSELEQKILEQEERLLRIEKFFPAKVNRARKSGLREMRIEYYIEKVRSAKPRIKK